MKLVEEKRCFLCFEKSNRMTCLTSLLSHTANALWNLIKKMFYLMWFLCEFNGFINLGIPIIQRCENSAGSTLDNQNWWKFMVHICKVFDLFSNFGFRPDHSSSHFYSNSSSSSLCGNGTKKHFYDHLRQKCNLWILWLLLKLYLKCLFYIFGHSEHLSCCFRLERCVEIGDKTTKLMWIFGETFFQ